MNLTSRDRKAVVVGGIIAGLILVIAYAVAPLVRTWFQRGTELGPKLAYVDKLRERVHGQDSLLNRRDVLVRRLGSLLGPEASGVHEQPVVPTTGSAETAAADEREKPAESEVEAASTEETAVTASPGAAESAVAGEQDKPGGSEAEVVPGEMAAGAETTGAAESSVTGEQEKPGESETEVAATASPGLAETSVAGEQETPGESEAETALTEEAAATAAAAQRGAAEVGRPSSGVSLAAHLERTAKKSGVKIKRISPKKQSRGRRGTRHFSSVALQIRIESDMQNLIKLLHALEKGERFVRIEQMQLRRDLKKGNNMEISLDIVGYEAVAR